MAEQKSSGNHVRPAKLPRRRISGRQMKELLRSAALGDVVTVLMKAPKHKSLSLDALRGYVLPALTHDQFFIARVRRQENGGGAVPTGLAIWASVSDDIDKRLRTSTQRLKLAPQEWNSGANLWLVDLVAPSVLAGSMLKDIDEKVAKGRPMAAQIVGDDGTAKVTTIKDMLASLPKEPA